MSNSHKGIFLGAILLIFFFIVGSACATENIADLDNLNSENDCCISIDSESNQYLQTSDQDILETSDTETNNNVFVNPDFETDENGQRPSGWNWSFSDKDAKSEDVYVANQVYDPINEVPVYSNCKVLHIEQGNNGYYPVISQNINFDNVDNISFLYCTPIIEYNSEWDMSFNDFVSDPMAPPFDHTFEIYHGEDLIDSIHITPKFGWQTITVDTRAYSDNALFKVKVKWANIQSGSVANHIYLDNFTVAIAPEQVASLISINSVSGKSIVSGVLKDISGNPIANAIINYTINTVDNFTSTDENGVFTINGIDNYEIFINYIGNDTIKPFTTSIKLDNLTGQLIEAQANVTQLQGKLDAANAEVARLTGQLSGAQANVTQLQGKLDAANAEVANLTSQLEAQSNVTELVNNLTEANEKIGNLTNQLNEAQTNVTKLAGELADVNQKAENLTTQLTEAQKQIQSLSAELISTNIAANTLTIKALDNGNIQVTLKDANNNLLANKSIQVIINGVVYNGKTEDNGVAKIAVKFANAGTYYATASFAGDDTYKSSIGTSKVVVNKKATALTASKATLKVKKAKKIKVTLKSNSKAVAGKTVTIKVNGKTFKAKTNSKGVATINVKVTKKGTFTATVKFAGDNTYNAISKKVKFTVKK